MSSSSKVAQALVAAAERIPGVTKGIACAGTALEARTFLAGSKTFLFVGAKDARLKLGESVAEAVTLAVSKPAALKVGAGGWLTIRFDAEGLPDAKVLRAWVEESHRGFAGGATRANPVRPKPKGTSR